MEFDKSRVYTSVNADELSAGDKVIAAHQLGNLKYQVSQKDYYVQQDYNVWTIREIKEDTYSDRFVTVNGAFPLVYLVERKENCTNCGEGKWDAEHQKILCDPVHCGSGNIIFRNQEIEVCEYWKPKTKCTDCAKSKNGGRGTCVLEEGYGCDDYEKKAEHKCETCKYVNCGFKDFNADNKCDRWEAESKTELHYRPFKDTDELVKVWEQKWSEKTNGQKWHDCKLNMPYIWIKNKHDDTDRGRLIISLSNNGCSVIDVDEIKVMLWEDLFEKCVFLDGSPCGVEE